MFRFLVICFIVLSNIVHANENAIAQLTGDLGVDCSINGVSSIEVDFSDMVSTNPDQTSEKSYDFDISCNTAPEYTIKAQYGFLKHEKYNDITGGDFRAEILYYVSLNVDDKTIIHQTSLKESGINSVISKDAPIPYKAKGVFKIIIPASNYHYVSGKYSDVITISIAGK